MACSHSPTCPLFPQFQLNSTLRSWKIMYCDSDARSKNCQRFKRSESGQTVPLNLLPNGTMLDVGTSPASGCAPVVVPAAAATATRPSAPAVPVSVVAQPLAAARVTPAPVVAPAAPVFAASPTAPASVAARAAPRPAAAPAAAPTVIRPTAPVLDSARATAASTPNAATPPAAARARSILDRILGRKG